MWTVSSGNPSRVRTCSTGDSVAENRVALRAARQRSSSQGAGTTLRMRRLGSGRPRPPGGEAQGPSSHSECPPNPSAMRTPCSASNTHCCSAGSGASGCWARCSCSVAQVFCSVLSQSPGMPSASSCVPSPDGASSRANALQRRCSASRALRTGGTASWRRRRKSRASSVALYIWRARGIRLWASSTSSATRQSWSCASVCQCAPTSNQWL